MANKGGADPRQRAAPAQKAQGHTSEVDRHLI